MIKLHFAKSATTPTIVFHIAHEFIKKKITNKVDYQVVYQQDQTLVIIILYIFSITTNKREKERS